MIMHNQAKPNVNTSKLDNVCITKCFWYSRLVKFRDFLLDYPRIQRHIPCDITKAIVQVAKDKLHLKSLLLLAAASQNVSDLFMAEAGGLIPHFDRELCELLPLERVSMLL